MDWLKHIKNESTIRDDFDRLSTASSFHKQGQQETINKLIFANEELKRQIKHLEVMHENTQLKLEKFLAQENELKNQISDLKNQINKISEGDKERSPISETGEGVKKFFNNIVAGPLNYEKRIKALETKISKLENLNQNNTKTGNSSTSTSTVVKRENKSMDDIFYINIWPEYGSLQKVYVNSLDITVQQLMRLYAKITETDVDSLQFTYDAKYLPFNNLLSTCGIKSGDTIDCFNVKKL